MGLETSEKIGSYAKKQLLGRNIFLTWSHRARFRCAVNLVRRIKPKAILDYGCGDGTFLLLLGSRVSDRTGYDSDENQIRDCKQRLGNEVHFLQPAEIDTCTETFDFVTCMEVLEHCTREQRFALYKRIQRLLRDNGHIVFSAPIEMGPALIFKHLVRVFLALTGVGDYKHRERYSLREFIRMLFAEKDTAIQRPLYTAKASGKYIEWHGHKGFNWRRLKAELEEVFYMESVLFTPNNFSRGLLSSQAWFVCYKKEKTEARSN